LGSVAHSLHNSISFGKFFAQCVQRVYLGFIYGLNVDVLSQPHVAVP